jgi:hypothetical protein
LTRFGCFFVLFLIGYSRASNKENSCSGCGLRYPRPFNVHSLNITVVNKRIIQKYVYPLLIIFFSIFPWWLFMKFVLKIDVLKETTNPSYLFFTLTLIIVFYVIFVRLDFSRKKQRTEEELRKYSTYFTYWILTIFSIQVLLIFILVVFLFVEILG